MSTEVKGGFSPRILAVLIGIALVAIVAYLATVGGIAYGTAQAAAPTATAYVNSPTGLNLRASTTTKSAVVGVLAHKTKVVLTCRSRNGQSVPRANGGKSTRIWGGTMGGSYVTAAYLRLSRVNAIRLARLAFCTPPADTGGASAGGATAQGGTRPRG